ncbi:ParB/RepB/Spo0J family partition protein, partial [Candidatus Uhrbacteria bacterium]|nr:ParB/RepB/Spo0J family partition protein [Candidatus Uhrbacteria bacterium]
MVQRLTGLGRGLGSLIPQKSSTESAVPAKSAGRGESAAPVAPVSHAENRILHIPVTDVVANPEQPRIEFRHHELEDLMNSIREHGILQPLLVTTRPQGGYELIAGERRFRAAKMLGLETVPAIVREADSNQKLLLALIENIQRQDLNPLEEARSYARLMSEYGLTQEDVAKRVGKARSTVANTVRLMDLPAEIQEAIASGSISAGSARAILSLKDEKSQLNFFRKLIGNRLTTREAETGARKLVGRSKDPAVAADEEALRRSL